MSLIELEDVCVSYDEGIPVLKGVSFAVEEGEFVALIGTNGAGKSTTVRLINALLLPESGLVRFEGTPTSELRTSQLAHKVGFLFQNPDSQICNDTVREELLFGLKTLGVDQTEADARADRVIEQFGFRADADPFLLNRGTRQLLALASTIVLETPVIVLDEPTTGLDYRECVKVMEIVRQLHMSGTTVIMVCHDMEVVADYAQRVVVMHDGQVVDDGPTFEVLRRQETLERASLVPPQIVDISMRLGQVELGARAQAALRANDLDAMTDAVVAGVRGE